MKYIQNIAGFSSKSTFAKLGTGFTQNMFVETKDVNEHTFQKVLLPFPGYALKKAVNGNPRGQFVVQNGYNNKPMLYCVFGSVLYAFYDETMTAVATIAQGDAQVSFAESSGYGDAHPHLFVSDGINIVCVDTSLSPALQSANSFFVSLPYRSFYSYEKIAPASICYANGYLNVLDEGSDRFFSSVQFPLADGNKDIFMVDEAPSEGNERPYYKVGYFTYGEFKGDETLKIVAGTNRLMSFGRASIEAYNYNSVSLTRNYLGGNVWTCPAGNAVSVGCLAKDTIARVGNRNIFVGQNDGGNTQVLSVGDSLEISVISTPEIERQIARYTIDNAYAFVMQWMQHPFYVLSFPNDKVTFAYDLREGGWVNLASDGDVFRYRNALNFENETLLQSAGALVNATEDKWNEHDNKNIVRVRSGSVSSLNAQDFIVNEISLITNNGELGKPNDRVLITMSYSTDGCTWQETSVHSAGSSGQYDYDATFYDLGEARYLAVKFSCSENTPFAIYGVKIDVEECVY